MDFKHHCCNSLATAQEETLNNPYCIFTHVKDETVLVTEAIFNPDVHEDRLDLENLDYNPRARKQLKDLLLIIHTDFLNHYKNQIFIDDNVVGVNDLDFIREWYSALQPTKKIYTEAPLISTDWETAQYEMSEDLVAYIHDLVDQKTRPNEEEIAQAGVEIFNEGIIKGWNAHREMVHLKKKYKQNLKQRSMAIYEDIKHQKKMRAN